MLTTTIELIELLNSKNSAINSYVITSLIHTIQHLGDQKDRRALLDQFLANAKEHSHSCLLPVFERHGTRNDAERILEACFSNNHPIEDVDPKVLELLGKLKYEPVKPLLTRYAFNSSDYYLSKYAALGLLNFDCSDLQTVILDAIEGLMGSNIFPEFIPALVCKLHNRGNLIERLYEFGSNECSTDCNAGILLGFSLCGEEGRSYFKKALYNSNWEVYSTASGTIFHAYEGMYNLGLTFEGEFHEIKKIKDSEQLSYALSVLMSLLEVKVRALPSAKPELETFKDIYLALFTSEGESVYNLCSQSNMQQDALRIQELIEIKMVEEAILKAKKAEA